MNCEFFDMKPIDQEELIEKYVAGQLSPKEMEDFELHYLSCDECYTRLTVREQMLGVAQEKGEILFRDFIGKEATAKRSATVETPVQIPMLPWKGKIGWVYAVGVAAVALVAIVYLNKDRSDSKPTENFKRHPYFEENIKNQGLKRSDAGFRIISPASGSAFNFKDEILFEWEMRGEPRANLEIMNNKGDKVFTVAPQATRYLFRAELSPGLYYWKVETEDDFRLDRFFIR